MSYTPPNPNGQATKANSTPVTIASDQDALPASQSGTWTVQPGNTANTTAWKVDGSAVTQPVSLSSVPSHAVTNIGTFAVQAAGTKTTNSAAPTTDNVGVLPAVANASSPSFAEGNQTLLSVDTAGNTRVTVNKLGGNAIATGNGASSTGVLRVAQVSDGTGVIATVSTVTNLAQMNGAAITMGNGVAGTGVQRVAIASDNTAFPVNATLSAETAKVIGTVNQGTSPWVAAGPTASGSSLTANPTTKGGLAKTANPTAVTDGQVVNSLHDKLGKQVVVGSIRDLKVNQITTITTSASETTVLTAVGSTFLDVYGVIVTNTSATAITVAFKDSTAGTTQFNIAVPAGDTRGFMLPEGGGIKQTTVNNNWTATTQSVTSVIITMLAVKNL